MEYAQKVYDNLPTASVQPRYPFLWMVITKFTPSVAVYYSSTQNRDNLLEKNVLIVFFFGNQIPKWPSFKKRPFLTYFSHFLVIRGKLQKFLQHISHSHTYMILLTLLTFLLYQFWKKKRIFQERFLFSVIPGVGSYSCHFETIKNNKMVSKI